MPAIASAPPDPGASTAAGSAPALALAGIAALLASTCCVLPLVFVLVGISGAWISQLHRLEPYSSWLAALAVASLGIAAWRLYRPATSAEVACAAPDAACRTVNAAARRWFWAVALLTLVPLVVPLAAPLFY
jgi:mercuric ion transport protein